MTAEEILEQLQPLGLESYKRVIQNHGVPEPLFGVKIEELKKFQRQIKTDYQLALDLYDTGVYDAMYLAGLVADDAKMTKKDLRGWARNAQCGPIAEYTVAWVAAGGKYGWELAREWIDSDKELVAVAGWATFAGVVATRPDDELDLAELEQLLRRVETTIHEQPNRVRYVMNGFVIAAGSYVASLTELALQVGAKVGKVKVDMGNTECKVPFAPEYIKKVQARGTIGKKRKTMKC